MRSLRWVRALDIAFRLGNGKERVFGAPRSLATTSVLPGWGVREKKINFFLSHFMPQHVVALYHIVAGHAPLRVSVLRSFDPELPASRTIRSRIMERLIRWSVVVLPARSRFPKRAQAAACALI